MFEKILIANRGEIALRINRACKEMGIATVAVHSTADADAMHVRLADESVCIGPPPAAQSYLNIPAIIAACEITGAEAIHPGYGFLSENARFAEIVTEHGITFIGPKPEHIRLMGDKIAAKAGGESARHSDRAGLGRRGHLRRGSDIASADEIGYPVLIKAAAGGGGRGMKVAQKRRGTEPRAVHGARRSQGRLRRRRRLYGEISREAAPHRSAGAGRCLRQGPASGRTRLLAAAPPPESLGRSALARAQRRATRRRSAASSPRRSPSSAIWAPAPSSSCTRTASSISSR